MVNLGGPQPVQPRSASWLSKTTAAQAAGKDTPAPRNTRVGVIEYQYINPPGFSDRDKQLRRLLEQILTKSEHSEFVSLSAAFRHGHISAFDYARGCSRLLGNQFERVFADLVVLLPDLTTQQALVDAWVRLHRPVAQVRVRKRGSAQGKPQAKGQAGKVENPLWARCQFCHQVVAPDDLREHETHHDLAVEQEFPSLLHVPKHKGKKALPKAWRK